MKQFDITPKIINLSKRIAKHDRMEIYKGCWFVAGATGKTLYLVEWKSPMGAVKAGDKIFQADDLIPIPSISDVLEKLQGSLHEILLEALLAVLEQEEARGE